MRRQRLIQILLCLTTAVYVGQVVVVFIWRTNPCPFITGGCKDTKGLRPLGAGPVTISSRWRDLNEEREQLKETLIQVAEDEDRLLPYAERHKPHPKNSLSLLEQMGNDWHWAWIKRRVIAKTDEFSAALSHLEIKQAQKKLHIVVIPGILTITNFARLSSVERGSPLGELLQWADLILGLHTLGHDVTLKYDLRMINAELRVDIEDSPASDPEGCKAVSYDVIYTDIGGFRHLQPDVVAAVINKIRILDAFGTEPAYNDEQYASSHGTAINHWGMLGLPTTLQFMTFFPHTPDNSFLGFTISQPKPNLNKSKVAIIMGKEARYLRGNMDFIKLLMAHFQVHVTIPHEQTFGLPGEIINHGIVASNVYRNISSSAKVLVGMGDPIESPAPLECIAVGCVFLNPLKSKSDQEQLRGKPTSRKITSQNDYLRNLGQPYVYTLDYKNFSEVQAVIELVNNSPPKPFVPHEFTSEGFLQRINYYLIQQHFCDNSTKVHPPLKTMKIIEAHLNESCSNACSNNGLTCDPLFFPVINDPNFLKKRGYECDEAYNTREVYAPCVQKQHQCLVQPSKHPIYSCAGFNPSCKRICPCRDFKPFQVALCKECD